MYFDMGFNKGLGISKYAISSGAKEFKLTDEEYAD